VTGEELLPTDRRILYVGNHVSNYDPIITWHVFPKAKLSFISKASNFKIPWFGRFIRRCCFMDIDRENPRNAIVTINRAAELLKNQEVSIGVYPEGTRSKSAELLPFHNGVFKIAQKANVDIAVVSLIGTEKIHKNFPLRRTDIYVDVLEIIPASEIKGVKTEIIGGRVEALLRVNKRKRETPL
jgi:1-acyl-sn-glycerol-3-phosphate acyltransferase